MELGAKGVISSLELCANLSFCVEAAVFCIHSRMAYCARACTWCRYLAHIRRLYAFRPRSQSQNLFYLQAARGWSPFAGCNIAPMSYKQMPASFPPLVRGREFAFLSFPLCAQKRTMGGGARDLYTDCCCTFFVISAWNSGVRTNNEHIHTAASATAASKQLRRAR